MIAKINSLKKYVALDSRTTPQRVSGSIFNVPENVGIVLENSGTCEYPLWIFCQLF
jgi:hypothetical protein